MRRCSWPANTELVRSLGAERVIDYGRTDFAAEGLSYDLILDTVGTITFARARPALAEGGRLLRVAADLAGNLGAALRPKRDGGRRVIAGVAAERPEALEFLMGLAARGAFRPHVDRRYRLDDIRDAHGLVESRRKRGNVIISIIPEGQAS